MATTCIRLIDHAVKARRRSRLVRQRDRPRGGDHRRPRQPLRGEVRAANRRTDAPRSSMTGPRHPARGVGRPGHRRRIAGRRKGSHTSNLTRKDAQMGQVEATGTVSPGKLVGRATRFALDRCGVLAILPGHHAARARPGCRDPPGSDRLGLGGSRHHRAVQRGRPGASSSAS